MSTLKILLLIALVTGCIIATGCVKNVEPQYVPQQSVPVQSGYSQANISVNNSACPVVTPCPQCECKCDCTGEAIIGGIVGYSYGGGC